MAHNIARINGTDQAWYKDKPAWHGLGTVTPGARTGKQVQRAVPAFRQPIELAPVYAKVGNRYIEVADKRATHRKGSLDMLGIVSDTYPPINDGDSLAVMEAVVNAARRASFASAGLLGKGERGFASIDLSRVVDLRIKRDPSRQEGFMFGTWSHDGTAALRVGLVNNRVDCQNMLNAALAYSERSGLLARIIHAGDTAKQIEEAQRILGFVEKVAKAHVAEMNALADIAIKHPAKWLDGFVELVVPIPENMERAGSREEARKVIRDLFLHSKTMVGVPTSPYRAYQAVAEYADHYRPLRIGADTPAAAAADKRWRSISEGPAAEMKSDALDILRREFLAPASVDLAYADVVVPVRVR
jgi:phage/plasmid-like protein (TIGR03299 family)